MFKYFGTTRIEDEYHLYKNTRDGLLNMNKKKLNSVLISNDNSTDEFYNRKKYLKNFHEINVFVHFFFVYLPSYRWIMSAKRYNIYGVEKKKRLQSKIHSNLS